MKKSLFFLFFIITSMSYTQENISFQKPSKEILDLADYTRPPSVMMDSKRETMILVYRPTYKTLEELNREDMKIAGLRIDPKTNISSTVSYVNNLKIKGLKDKKEKQVKNLPKNPKLANYSFSPDEKYLAFTHTTAKGVQLRTVTLTNPKETKITAENQNANSGRPHTSIAEYNS